jgi:hypothetical protein
VQFAQLGAVVGVERDGERAAAAVAQVPAGGLGQLGGEVRVAARGGEVQGEQRLLAVVTAASIPAATCAAPPPGSGSTTAVANPRCAARQAVTRPMIPPPMTRTSGTVDASRDVDGSSGVRDMGVQPLPSPA